MELRTRTPVDLYAIVVAATLLVLVVLVLPEAGALRIALGLPFVLFFPGYALVAALFPERHVEGSQVARSLSPLERVALGLGLSIAVVPLLGLALNYTPWGIRLVPVLVTVYAFTLLMSAIAIARRRALPRVERPEFALALRGPEWRALPTVDRALVVATVVALLVAGGSVAYVLTTPRDGERFTEFYILGEGGKAEGYPTTLAAGGAGTILVGTVNHEHEIVRYEVRPYLVEVTYETNATGARRPVEGSSAALPPWTFELPDGGTDEGPWSFTVPTSGPYKLVLELHRDGQEGAYRTLHLWINAEAAP